MTDVAAPTRPLIAPSERLRVAIALTRAGGNIGLDREFCEQLLAENAAIRNMVSDEFAAAAVAEAKPILDRAGAMLLRSRRELRAAFCLNILSLTAALCIGAIVGWF